MFLATLAAITLAAPGKPARIPTLAPVTHYYSGGYYTGSPHTSLPMAPTATAWLSTSVLDDVGAGDTSTYIESAVLGSPFVFSFIDALVDFGSNTQASVADVTYWLAGGGTICVFAWTGSTWTLTGYKAVGASSLAWTTSTANSVTTGNSRYYVVRLAHSPFGGAPPFPDWVYYRMADVRI